METKCLIVGAGISGLTLANYLKNDDYIIIEKDEQIGGYCKTIKKADFIWDYAGHFYHFKDEEIKKLFMEKMSNEEIIHQEKNTKIYYGDRLIDYPFQTNIHQLPKQEFIDCLYDLYNKIEKENYDNFLDMLYGKFGKSIVEKFLKPYNEKLYACNLNNLDKNAMGRFFPYADIKKIINNMKEGKMSSYNDTFLYPKNGAQSFINKLYDSLDKTKIKLNTEIVNIDINQKKAITNNGEEIKFEYLVNTSPLNNFLKLINTQESKKIESELSYNKVLVFNLGFEKKSTYKEHWIYFPQQDINFYRVGFYDNILNSDKLSMYIEIGFSKDDKIDVEKELKDTLKNLEKIGITNNNKLLEYSTIIMDPAYVHINEHSSNDITNFMEKINNNNVYSIGRYGEWTYCSMEDCMLESKRLSNIINNA